MENLARKLTDHQVFQEYGQVLSRSESSYTVQTDTGSYEAEAAVSCLVRPETGDLVLVALGGDPERSFILAVLERPGEEKTVLAFKNDVEILVPEGRFEVAVRDELKLACARDLSLLSSGLNVTAEDGEVNVGSLSFWGRIFEGRIEAIKVLATTFDTVADRMFQRLKRYYRFVEGAEQVKAGRRTCLVKDSMVLRARFAQMTAEEDVHIDGKQIHIG